MKKILTVLLLMLSTSAIAKSKPEVVYVGDGRYVCQGDRNSLACAQVDTYNRQREEHRAFEYERKRDEEERRRRELESNSRNSIGLLVEESCSWHSLTNTSCNEQ